MKYQVAITPHIQRIYWCLKTKIIQLSYIKNTFQMKEANQTYHSSIDAPHAPPSRSPHQHTAAHDIAATTGARDDNEMRAKWRPTPRGLILLSSLVGNQTAFTRCKLLARLTLKLILSSSLSRRVYSISKPVNAQLLNSFRSTNPL